MTALLISYDLRAPGRNYDELYEYLRGDVNWWHHLTSSWILVTQKSTETVRDEILSLLDSNDKVHVVDITGAEASWYGFDETGSKWLHDNWKS